MSRWNLAWLLGITAANFLALAILQSAPTQGPLQTKHENYRLMVEAVEEVQSKYVKPLNTERMRELFEDMLNLGLEQLDPHSGFINAEEYKHFMKSSRGKFGGVGIKIGMDRARQIFVESPIVGTPAYEAGIEAGDLIVKIDGHSTENMSMKKAIDMIQGDPGQKITLTVLHENSEKPVDVTMARAEIMIDSVLGDLRMNDKMKEWDFMMDKQSRIAYIRITQFTETTADDLAKVISQLQKDEVKGLILDLRTNPGGLLRSAVEVSSLFLPEGKRVVSTKGRDGKGETYDAKRFPGRPAAVVDVPIAILLNRYSASASEIVAAALQDHLRAVIIGERSYGKGSVQNIIPLENGTTALKLTTASYWRPSEKNIHRFRDSKEKDEWGVKPNEGFEVELTDKERLGYFKYRRERDVVRKSGTKPEAEQRWLLVPWNIEVLRPEPYKDRVVEKALEYLREKTKGAKVGAAPALPGREETAVQVPTPQPVVREALPGRASLQFRESPEFIGKRVGIALTFRLRRSVLSITSPKGQRKRLMGLIGLMGLMGPMSPISPVSPISRLVWLSEPINSARVAHPFPYSLLRWRASL